VIVVKPNVKWGVTGLVLGLAIALTLPTIAQQPSPESGSADRTVSTNGVAIVRSSPDEAVVTLGVSTEASTAEQAMDANAEQMSDVVNALLDAGLSQDDLATASINLYPRWNDSGTAVDGFTAENQVTVTVGNLDRVGAIIDRAVAAGANLAGGITFKVSDTNEAADRALEEAVADARRKAEVLAEAGGAQLGAVVSISETSSSVTPPLVYAREAAVAADASTPILPPTMESQVSVIVVWSLV
jgi:uncharacterized protein YggE